MTYGLAVTGKSIIDGNILLFIDFRQDFAYLKFRRSIIMGMGIFPAKVKLTALFKY